MPLAIFDFDGVICDSTPECLVVTLATNLEFFEDRLLRLDVDEMQGLLDNIQNPTLFGQFFMKHRKYVRWPREYLFISESFQADPSRALNQLDFDAFSQHQTMRAKAYEALFLSVRDRIRKSHYDLWIETFQVFEDVIKSYKEIAKSYEVCILTGRDAASVYSVMQKAGADLPLEHIYDVRRYSSKVDGMRDLLRDFNTTASHAIFIDDNIMHLKQMKSFPLNLFWATWGYVQDDHWEIAKSEPNAIAVTRDSWFEKVCQTLRVL